MKWHKVLACASLLLSAWGNTGSEDGEWEMHNAGTFEAVHLIFWTMASGENMMMISLLMVTSVIMLLDQIYQTGTPAQNSISEIWWLSVNAPIQDWLSSGKGKVGLLQGKQQIHSSWSMWEFWAHLVDAWQYMQWCCARAESITQCNWVQTEHIFQNVEAINMQCNDRFGGTLPSMAKVLISVNHCINQHQHHISLQQFLCKWKQYFRTTLTITLNNPSLITLLEQPCPHWEWSACPSIAPWHHSMHV